MATSAVSNGVQEFRSRGCVRDNQHIQHTLQTYQYGAVIFKHSDGNIAARYTSPMAPDEMSFAPAIMITYAARDTSDIRICMVEALSSCTAGTAPDALR